jgi:hypothetical protein
VKLSGGTGPPHSCRFARSKVTGGHFPFRFPSTTRYVCDPFWSRPYRSALWPRALSLGFLPHRSWWEGLRIVHPVRMRLTHLASRTHLSRRTPPLTTESARLSHKMGANRATAPHRRAHRCPRRWAGLLPAHHRARSVAGGENRGGGRTATHYGSVRESPPIPLPPRSFGTLAGRGEVTTWVFTAEMLKSTFPC